jgi:alkanesulfonate monooxygenase SsuD/methylene tetrahydromethanopterin reductase-like flavin-dependent oxidoreductase (luciferase family)
MGFDSIYAYDHLIPYYKNDVNKNIFECLTLLSSLTAITKRVKIGQIVTCNSYRNPSLLAKITSTLDVIRPLPKSITISLCFVVCKSD